MKYFSTVLFCCCFLLSCVKEDLSVNNKEEVYGLYLNIDTSKITQQFNFSEPYIWLQKKEGDVVRYYDYSIYNNSCFDGEGNYIFEIVYLKGRDLKMIEIENGEILEFRNKY